MINTDLLRGKIYTKYRSASEYARTIKWNRQRLHKIINGQKTPNVQEIKLFQESLHLTESEVFAIFLPSVS